MTENEYSRDLSMDVASMVNQRRAQQAQTHGDVVTDNEGIPGIYIDKQEVIRRETETPQIKAINEKLAEMDSQIAAYQRGDTVSRRNDTATNERIILSRVNPDNPETADIRKVADMFADFEPSSNGLAPKGSREAIDYKNRMADIESGKVDPSTFAQNDKAQHNEPVMNAPVPDPVPAPTQIPNKVETGNDKVVQFNVSSTDVKTFLGTMTNEELGKVSRADTIVVNEIQTLNIPTAQRTISSFDEFKRIIPRLSYNDTVDTALINSGYIASFKGCGALAMAVLAPNSEDEPIDYAKQYQFCYDNLVNTSIGKMSFNEFCLRTHINDLSTCLLAILRASDPNENDIVLECATCKKNYPIKYRLTELLDVDSITDPMTEQIEKIVGARHTYEDAMNVHMASPVMTAKYVEVEMSEGYKVIVELKPSNGNTVIERFPKLRDIAQKYSGYVAAIITYIPKVTIQVNNQLFDVIDPYAISEIIASFDVKTTRMIGEVMNKMVEYPAPTYSFKGKFKCPECGRDEENVPCTIESLVFYKVGMAMR